MSFDFNLFLILYAISTQIKLENQYKKPVKVNEFLFRTLTLVDVHWGSMFSIDTIANLMCVCVCVWVLMDVNVKQFRCIYCVVKLQRKKRKS